MTERESKQQIIQNVKQEIDEWNTMMRVIQRQINRNVKRIKKLEKDIQHIEQEELRARYVEERVDNEGEE